MNIAKHANARNAAVTIFKNETWVHVIVKDDGVGFRYSQKDSEDSTSGKFGLFSIREQLEYLGGRLQIESKHGHGTTVKIVVPVSNISA
jgi:signal transduction histidine kinase